MGDMEKECVSFEPLLDYLDKRISGAEQQHIAAHLASRCARCLARRNWYVDFKQTTQLATVEPPDWVLRRAARLFETVRRDETAVTRLVQGVAQLLFDSFAQPLAGRRAMPSMGRQLLYAVEAFNVDLQITGATGANANLYGQILSVAEAGFASVADLEVKLSRGGKLYQTTRTNALGEFTFTEVRCDTYELGIAAKNVQLTIADLPLTPKN